MASVNSAEEGRGVYAYTGGGRRGPIAGDRWSIPGRIVDIYRRASVNSVGGSCQHIQEGEGRRLIRGRGGSSTYTGVLYIGGDAAIVL